MDTLRLSIVTPNGSIFNGDVKTVTLPGKEGEFGVLPGHASLVSSLTVGVIIIEKENTTEAVAINWGHVNVSETSVDVLADGAVSLTQGGDSDIAKAIDAAKELVNSVSDANVSIASVEARINSFS
ncbi:MAG: ATP synthase F1 subunit epsilon [Arcobacter sp.]|jgi:F-type H+-transporting ATPase subunit epsilon|uniref:ATP synthase F1 subunit epsilon n=1 Tax=Arcobacter sp. TaxID=1872629 RepID=UPI000CC16E0F|nr:ATP synthase F1 subunit epsilon [uncultured Arcobacter sp.]PLY10280.1 MAG: F0F1 ATP synthase subunit epsilon [Arcobacter sp.]